MVAGVVHAGANDMISVYHQSQELLYDRWGRLVHRYVDGQMIKKMVRSDKMA